MKTFLLAALLALVPHPVPAADLSELKRTLKHNKTEAKRLDALQAIAELDGSDGGPSRSEIAAAIALGLKDKKVGVREDAARRLETHGDPEKTPKDLSTAIEVAMRKAKALNKKANKKADSATKTLMKDIGKVVNLPDLNDPKALERAAKQMELQLKRFEKNQKKFEKIMDEVGELYGQARDELTVANAASLSLTAYPSEKSLKLVRRYHDYRIAGGHASSIPAARALLRFGLKSDVAKLTASFAVYAQNVEDHEKRERRRFQEEKNYEPWEMTEHQKWGARLHKELVKFAEARELEEPPDWDEDEDYVADMKEWYDSIAGELPTELPAS